MCTICMHGVQGVCVSVCVGCVCLHIVQGKCVHGLCKGVCACVGKVCMCESCVN